MGAQPRILELSIEEFAYRKPFRISGHVFEKTVVLVATVKEGDGEGRGEGAGAYYLGDDIGNMVRQAEEARGGAHDTAARLQRFAKALPTLCNHCVGKTFAS